MKRILSVFLVIFMLAASFTAMAVPASAESTIESTIDTYDFDFESDTLDGVAGTFAQGWYFRSNYTSSVGQDADNPNRYLKLTGTSNYLQTYLSYSDWKTNVYNPGDQFVFSYDIRIPGAYNGSMYQLRLFNPRFEMTAGGYVERQIFTCQTDGKGKGTIKVDMANVCSKKDGDGSAVDFTYGVWHNIAVSVNATTYELYIDGAHIATAEMDSAKITNQKTTDAGKFGLVTLGVNDSVNQKELHYDNIKYTKNTTTPAAPTHLPPYEFGERYRFCRNTARQACIHCRLCTPCRNHRKG